MKNEIELLKHNIKKYNICKVNSFINDLENKLVIINDKWKFLSVENNKLKDTNEILIKENKIIKARNIELKKINKLQNDLTEILENKTMISEQNSLVLGQCKQINNLSKENKILNEELNKTKKELENSFNLNKKQITIKENDTENVQNSKDENN